MPTQNAHFDENKNQNKESGESDRASLPYRDDEVPHAVDADRHGGVAALYTLSGALVAGAPSYEETFDLVFWFLVFFSQRREKSQVVVARCCSSPSSFFIEHTHTSYRIVSYLFMDVLSWIASTAAKQAVLMALLASLPGLWWTYSGLTEDDLDDPAKFASSHVLLSLGLCLLVAGLAYKVRVCAWGLGARGGGWVAASERERRGENLHTLTP